MSRDRGAGVQQEWFAFLNSIRFFTRIRVPDRIPFTAELQALSTKYLPAVGLIVGAASALVFILSLLVFPKTVSVLLSMITSLLMTGAFHEDGLSDTADGLGGGWEKDRILAIMKDSRVGSYGVIAIVMVLMLKLASLSDVATIWIPVLLVCGHAFSRYCAILIMSGMHYVRTDASSKARQFADKLSRNTLIIASLFGLVPLLLLPFPAMLLGLVAGLLATIWMGRQLQKWLGGYTGDCLGAVQQLSEVAFYLGALAALR